MHRMRLSEEEEAEEEGGGQPCPPPLDRETVFEWFGLCLRPAARLELLCGLLRLCQPLELRFTAACLEEVARGDAHALRESEARANSAAELAELTDPADATTRARLLVCVSLLARDNRACAALLYRALSRAGGDTRGVSEDRTRGHLEELELLYCMATLHPAFPFHQREELAERLRDVREALRGEEERSPRYSYSCPNEGQKTICPNGIPASRRCEEPQPPTSDLHPGQAVHIEKILLTGITGSKTRREYGFVVTWSDGSTSNVTKRPQELEAVLKRPCEASVAAFERAVGGLLGQVERGEGWEVERTLREKLLSAPAAFRWSEKVCSFFLHSGSSPGASASALPPKPGKDEDDANVHSEEDGSLPLPHGHKKKYDGKNSGGAKTLQAECQRALPVKTNGVTDWRTPCAFKPGREAAGMGSQLCADVNRSSYAGNRSDMTDTHGKKDRTGCVTSSVLTSVPQQPHREGVGQVHAERSSQSSSRTAGLQDSQENREEKSTDTPDEPHRGTSVSFLCTKPVGVTAVATVRPMVTFPPPPKRDDGTPLPGVPVVVRAPGAPPSDQRPVAAPSPHPIIQRFRMPGPTLPPMGAISVIATGPGVVSPLQPAYPDPKTINVPPSYVCPPMPTPVTSQGDVPPPSQQQQTGCGACGCHGNCGTLHALGYCYPRQMLALQPFVQLAALSGGYLGNAAAQLPSFPPVYGGMPGYSLQHFYPPLFPALSVLPKKSVSSGSCYNCGVSGHYAQDCRQPAADAAQQGGFRLRFVPPQTSEGLDKAD